MSLRKDKPALTPNAELVLKKRYLLPGETPQTLFGRVARAVASIEKKHAARWEKIFYEMMAELKFLPNSPTLMNAGRKEGQLSACFVLPIKDSLDSIFDTMKYAAKIHQSGGGTGFSFSRLRASGAPVRSTSGVASGPISFLKIYNIATETIKQGGQRRGANMGILRIDHPDILEFVELKKQKGAIENFNLSVAMSDEFMKALDSGSSYDLVEPSTRKKVKSLDAHQVFNQIAHAAWACGDPGLIFIDRINLFNPTPQEGEMESTNPCGEQPLLPFESCNLGSINLGLFVKSGKIQWADLAHTIHAAVRFLDNVIDLNHYPVAQSKKITLKNRKIGLGVMGFADLLILLKIPYNSEAGRDVAKQVMSFLDEEAKRASQKLAKEKGAFKNWKGSRWQKQGYPKMRNATVSTVAPTGTISMIAGASSGIEPIFSSYFIRHVLDGETLVDVPPVIQKVLGEELLTASRLNPQKIEFEVRRALGSVWVPAAEVSVEDHVKMQAVFQEHSDSAVSKTVNLSESATVDDVKRAYLLAYRLGCKGITVYRDKSKDSQVLNYHAACKVCET